MLSTLSNLFDLLYLCDLCDLSDLSDLSKLSDFFSCMATCSPPNSVNHWELVQVNGTGIVKAECPSNKLVLGCGIRRGKYLFLTILNNFMCI